MLEIAAIMVVSFVLIFCFSLLEVVWLTIYDDDVVAYESRCGRNTSTATIKQLLRERMVVAGFILFAIHLLTYFTPLILGRFTRDIGGLVYTMLAVYPLFLFFFGEIVSKNIGYRYATPVAILSAVLIKWLLKIFWPVTWSLRLTNKLTGGKDLRLYSEKDVIATAEAAKEHGTLHPEEAEFIQRALEVGNHQVADFMIPLGKCVAVSLKPTRQQLIDAVNKRSRVVVCAVEDPQTIIGVVTAKDVVPILLKGKLDEKVDLTGKLHPTVDLPQNMSIPEAFRFLRKRSFGTVTDNGKMVGFITLRGILDQMVDAE